uniref:NAD kinase 2 n=1 Tax=Schistocephalus solidus TaxID=70667 RepID=A0A0X3P076_SCHSO
MCGAHVVLLSSVLTPLRIFCRTLTDVTTNKLSPFKRTLIVSKRSAYAHEQSRSSYTDEAALEKSILERGKSFNDMKRAHRFHAQIIAELTRCLRAHDVEVRVVDFKEYDFSDAEWSDLIISVGGDGTFLSAASKVLSRDKVLVGLNSRPASSEGSLCTANWWYRRIPEFVDRLMLGKFSRFWRQRIRLQLAPYIAPLETQHPEIVNIYNISPNFSPARVAKGTENLDKSRSQTPDSATLTRTLPFRALNEVFVSSSMSARVSEYEISLDGSKFVRQKSSGLIVCTGTGSSAWYYNTNRVTPSLVHSLLALTEEELVACASNERPELQQLQQQSRGGFAGYHSDLPLVNPLQRTSAKTRSLCGKSLTELAEAVAQKYNQELFFSPEAPHMGYAIRDLVANSIFKFGPPFGFAYKYVSFSDGSGFHMTVSMLLSLLLFSY